MTFWICVFLGLASYLVIAPLPKSIQLPNSIKSRKSIKSQKLESSRNKLRSIKKTQFSFEEQLQFLYCIKSQLLAGATQINALKFALSRINESLLVETRKNIPLQAGITAAMKRDAKDFKFSTLGNYALLMEASAVSGASTSQALSNLTSTMIRNHTQAQLVETELASTKATVLVLAGLPIIGAGMALVLGSQSVTWLFTTNAGRVCLLLGLTLEILGWNWVKRLLKKALADPA